MTSGEEKKKEKKGEKREKSEKKRNSVEKEKKKKKKRLSATIPIYIRLVERKQYRHVSCERAAENSVDQYGEIK